MTSEYDRRKNDEKLDAMMKAIAQVKEYTYDNKVELKEFFAATKGIISHFEEKVGKNCSDICIIQQDIHGNGKIGLKTEVIMLNKRCDDSEKKIESFTKEVKQDKKDIKMIWAKALITSFVASAAALIGIFKLVLSKA